MKVRVRALASLRDVLAPSLELELEEGATVSDLLARLVEVYGRSLADNLFDPAGKLLPFIKVFVNGRDIDFLSGLGTRLADGDEVVLIPPAGGG